MTSQKEGTGRGAAISACGAKVNGHQFKLRQLVHVVQKLMGTSLSLGN